MIKEFSSATLANLERNPKRKYYVYCLCCDNEIFYIGKGCDNRVFHHERYAQGILNNLSNDDVAQLELIYEKQSKIRKIVQSGNKVQRFIVNFFLTEEEAFACENALINLLKLVGKIDLTNLVKGHGVSGFTVEQLDKELGFEKISLDLINTSHLQVDDLILAVKIKDSFRLDAKNENESYDGALPSDRDNNNLKSRTLGIWAISKRAAENIKYVIGVNTGADNAVVSAYGVKSYHSAVCKDRNGNDRLRYYFLSDDKSEDILKKLGLYKKSLPELKFGSGQAIAYIKNKI